MQDTRERTNAIYGEWVVLHPGGFEMFRCVDRKANWYLTRGLAKKVLESPPTIQLLFEPGGVGWKDDKFALTKKQNKCVVCGTEDLPKLTRHHITPSLYKKHFPKELKVATSHDVVCICRECHDEYEHIYALKLKDYISEKYNVPLCNSHSDFIKVIKLSKAFVLKGSAMPEERRIELMFRISILLGYEEDFVSIEEIEKFSKISQKDYNEFHNNHGRDVMSKITDIQAFVEMWRLNFVESMKPRFMPKFWSVKRPVVRLDRPFEIK